MNELSWLIYAADVAGKAGFVFGFGSIVLGVGAGAAWAAHINYTGEYKSSLRASAKDSGAIDPYYKSRAEDEKLVADSAKRIAWPASIVAVLFVLTSVFAPSRETLYAIAASEMGERVIQSETGGKAINALNAWLDRQIDAPATEPAQ